MVDEFEARFDPGRRRGCVMGKYALFFTFKGETIASFIEHPSDRMAAVRRLAEAAGGTVEDYYWMFGQYDGFAVLNAPDAATAAALSLAVSATKAFAHIETHELIEAADLGRISSRAKTLLGDYVPPGA
jgi:uncharacterized protein with GYD domain